MSEENPYKGPATERQSPSIRDEFSRTIKFLNMLSWLVPLAIPIVVAYMLFSATLGSILFGVAVLFSVFMGLIKKPKRGSFNKSPK